MGNLSACYEDGKGTEPNAEEGRKWLMMVVENGNAVSQNYYATLLRDSEGRLERDLEGARKWFEEASETDADACFNLGLIHIDENPELAFKYYARGAEVGHMECMSNLGILYKDGQGVERDLKVAFQWFKVSTSLGNAMVAYNLARAYGNEEGTKANHTLYIDWLLASAEGGNPLAMHDLEVESESKGEYAEALGWYEAAGYLGYADSINNIGSLHYNGKVPAGDGEGIQLTKAGRKKAFDYYIRAAELGSAEGHFNLASYYMSGHMVRRSIDMAKEHYQATEKGHAVSTFNLAAIHANEFRDLDGFQIWVWKAADAGFQQTIDTIGKFGVPRPGEEPDGE